MSFNPDQPRHPAGSEFGGQWTAAGLNRALIGARKGAGVTPETGSKLLEMLMSGGFTESLEGETPSSGYMAAFSSETELMIPVESLDNLGILEYMENHFSELAKEGNYFGGWVDSDEKGVMMAYLDVSKNVQSLSEAMGIASAADQVAIWDLENNQSLYVDEYKED